MTSYKIYSEELSVRSKQLLDQIREESAHFKDILDNSASYDEFKSALHRWADEVIGEEGDARDYYDGKASGEPALEKVDWPQIAAIRILDYLENSGREFVDLNQKGKKVLNAPFRMLWQAYKQGKVEATEDFFEDMLHLFRQITGRETRKLPEREVVMNWMDRHPTGLDERVIKLREENRDRILEVLMEEIDSGRMGSTRFHFEPGMSRDEKMLKMKEWWKDYRFHLRFAIRSTELLNKALGYTISEDLMKVLQKGRETGIPTFVNPYYLSLLHVNEPEELKGTDQAIRDYIFISRELVDEFGDIVAWEMEDVVEPGKPNAAGWILPTKHNLHRRYPEVAILIPETVGRACGGLCVSCQRMYDFQSGNLNFNLERLEPNERWPEKLRRLMEYFENDAQLRDILITGGDALMSSDKSLQRILDEVYNMAVRKKEKNRERKEGEKYAEMLRVRLGTRLPVYLPQRITPSLVKVLADFKEKASKIGIKQFVIQTHFETSMEITPEVKQGIEMLSSAGWIVTNQQVFIAAASQRGHTAKLRKTLNDIGVLPYYTFSVKGYMENFHSFAPNARAVQEKLEEKAYGQVPEVYHEDIKSFPHNAEKMKELVDELRDKASLPFLATDRSVINLPGVGKSLTYRVIGITRHGRRILEFDHDHTRRHSPIINEMGKVIIIESKTIPQYIRQMEDLGEDVGEYLNVYGYSIGETESRMPIYEYPKYEYKQTPEMTNLSI